MRRSNDPGPLSSAPDGQRHAARRTARRRRAHRSRDSPRPHVPQHRPRHHRRPNRRFRGCRERALHDLRRDRFGGCVQDDQRRHVVGAGLRSGADGVHRGDRGLAESPERGVDRVRRGEQRAQLLVGQRRLPVARRRPHVGPPRARQVAACRPRRHSSDESGHRVCRGARRALGIERGARAVQDRGRRGDVEPGVAHQQIHRRRGRRDRSARPGGAVRGVVPARTPLLQLPGRRAGERRLQERGRREDVAETRDGAAGRRPGTHRTLCLPDTARSGLRGDRRSAGGRLPVRRSGRELGAAHRTKSRRTGTTGRSCAIRPTRSDCSCR